MPQNVPFSNLFTTVYQKRLVLTSAQILALASTPITIIPAPASTKYIQVISIVYSLTYGTTTYAAGTGAGLYYNTSSGTAIDTHLVTALLETSSYILTEAPTLTAAATNLAGLPVVVAATGAPTTGNGTVSIVVTYSVNTL